MIRGLLAALLIGSAAVPAGAAWKVATSDHFTVYTEGSEQEARDTAALLEKYRIVLRTVTGTKEQDSPLKPDIFMVPTQRQVAEALPFGGGEGVAGFYSASIRGPYAVMLRRGRMEGVERAAGGQSSGMSPQHVLLHETTHHFTAQYFPAAYPSWYAEGLADFLGSARFKPDNVVEVGAPVANRYLTVQEGTWLPLRTLLSARNYSEVKGSIAELYAEGWLLVHYLSVTDKRPGQLAAYLKAINAGVPYRQAAETAFGDLDRLDAELRAYAKAGKLNFIVLPFKQFDTGPIATRALTPAEEAVMPYRIELQAGVEQAGAAALADRAAVTAKAYPADPEVLAVVADVERVAGRAAAASATADRWLATAPDDGRAMAFKAILQLDALAAAKSTDTAAWDATRRALVAASKKAPDQPRTLQAYYRTYAARGLVAPVSAQNALIRAFEILPQDDGLRIELARELERQGAIDEAITVIKPLAVTVRDPESLTPAQRKRRDEMRARYQIAENVFADDAPAMLARLEKKKAEGGAQPARPAG